MIVIVIVSVGLVVVPVSSRPAQAPDSPVDYRYYMDVVNPRTSICIGETVHYTVIVNRTPAAGDLAPKPAVRSRAASASPAGCPPSADLIYQSLVDLREGRTPDTHGARFGR